MAIKMATTVDEIAIVVQVVSKSTLKKKSHLKSAYFLDHHENVNCS